MIKTIFLSLLITFSIGAADNNLFSENSFVAVVSNKQSGIFYGDPLTRELVKRSFFSGVYIIYKDPSQENTRTEFENSLKRIAQRLNAIKPARIFISNKDVALLDYLSDINRAKVTILPNTLKAQSLRHADQITDLIKYGRIKHNYIYILQDLSEISQIQAEFISAGLVISGTDKKLVKKVTIKDFQSLRKFFRSDERRTQSVIINKLFTLRDVELNSMKFSDDIKRELISVNRQHVDIGFEQAAYNEAFIIQDNSSDVYSDIVDGVDTYIRVNVLINKKRINKLNHHHVMVNYFYRIDGILQ